MDSAGGAARNRVLSPAAATAGDEVASMCTKNLRTGYAFFWRDHLACKLLGLRRCVHLGNKCVYVRIVASVRICTGEEVNLYRGSF